MRTLMVVSLETYISINIHKGRNCICAFTRMTNQLSLLREKKKLSISSQIPPFLSSFLLQMVDGFVSSASVRFIGSWQHNWFYFQFATFPSSSLTALCNVACNANLLKLPVAWHCLCAPNELMEARLKQVYIASNLLDNQTEAQLWCSLQLAVFSIQKQNSRPYHQLVNIDVRLAAKEIDRQIDSNKR